MTQHTDLPTPSFETSNQNYIEKARDSEVIEGFTESTGLSFEDALTWVVGVQATDGIDGAHTVGQAAEAVSRRHSLLKLECSALYVDLMDENPTMTKAELNAVPELADLNAVRRGMRMAMNSRYRIAQYSKPYTQF